jgi:NADH dehydrogenase (ubiquinone) 1 alpha subcomplex subunit 9
VRFRARLLLYLDAPGFSAATWSISWVRLLIATATSSFYFDATAKTGTQVIVPYRDEDEKRHLKVMGDLGQIVPLVRCCVLGMKAHRD